MENEQDLYNGMDYETFLKSELYKERLKNLDPEYSERYKEQFEYTKNKEYEKERKNLISKILERIEEYYKLEEEHEKKHGVIFGNFDFYYDNGYLADKYSDEYEFIVLNPEHLLHILLNEDLEELLHDIEEFIEEIKDSIEYGPENR